MKLSWRLREPPLPAGALLADGPVARRLAARLLAGDDASLAALTAVAGQDLLVIRGELLPWVDGVVHLGEAPEAPGWWLPCTLAAEILPLWVSALARRGVTPPAVLVGERVIPLAAARPLDRARLQAWTAA